MTVAARRAGKLMLCPALSNVTAINLFVTRPGNAAQLWDQLRTWSLMNIDYADPLQDRSALSLTDFYTTFRDAPGACFRPFKEGSTSLMTCSTFFLLPVSE